MEVHELVQGSAEWLAYRATKFNASDAPAMMGVSPYKSRTQLLNERKTGVVPEPDARTADRYADGHKTEALARPLAEEIIGEELYAVVGSLSDLSASFDGLTITDTKPWECKRVNADLRAMFAEVDSVNPKYRTDKFNELLHPMYRVQMEQQCIVSGESRVLFTAAEFDADGELVEAHHGWYRSNPELAEAIRAGWVQFKADLVDHEPTEVVDKPVAAVIEALPALVVNVEGRVTSSNLGAFKAAASKFIGSIKTDLQTDQDFADAERTVKFCKEGEDRLDLVKSQALAQTASIDDLFRTVDGISEELRQTRLKLAKLVETRKVSIRTEKVVAGQKVIEAYVAGLNKRLGADWIPRPPARYAEVIKGKRTVESLDNAISTAIAHDKIEYSAMADRLAANRASLIQPDTDWSFLFADFATVGQKPCEDFSAIAQQRINAHKEAQAEAERKRAAEAAAKAQADAEAAAQREAEAIARRNADVVRLAHDTAARVDRIRQDIQAVADAGKAPVVQPALRRADDSTPAEPTDLRAEWAMFEVALARVQSCIDKNAADIDRRRFVAALERMRAFANQTINEEGEVTC